MNPRGPSRASKSQKTAFSKSGFRVGHSPFFRSWGLPKERQGAQEGSQKTPKELQDPKKKRPKIGPKNYKKIRPILEQFWEPERQPVFDQK